MKRKILEKKADDFLKSNDSQKLGVVSKGDSFELRRLQKKNDQLQFVKKKIIKNFFKFL